MVSVLVRRYNPRDTIMLSFSSSIREQPVAVVGFPQEVPGFVPPKYKYSTLYVNKSVAVNYCMALSRCDIHNAGKDVRISCWSVLLNMRRFHGLLRWSHGIN